jgi:hypothetical protein
VTAASAAGNAAASPASAALFAGASPATAASAAAIFCIIRALRSSTCPSNARYCCGCRPAAAPGPAGASSRQRTSSRPCRPGSASAARSDAGATSCCHEAAQRTSAAGGRGAGHACMTGPGAASRGRPPAPTAPLPARGCCWARRPRGLPPSAPPACRCCLVALPAAGATCSAPACAGTGAGCCRGAGPGAGAAGALWRRDRVSWRLPLVCLPCGRRCSTGDPPTMASPAPGQGAARSAARTQRGSRQLRPRRPWAPAQTHAGRQSYRMCQERRS